MTRNGKIARLPYGIREELNRRLRNGESGRALLKWLNEDFECGEVLVAEFGGRPISKQNLSEWRQGGYKDWVGKEEARQRVQVVMEKAEDLEEDVGGMRIADRLGTLLAAELAIAVEQLESIEDPKERWVRLKDIARETYRLRREDHHARKLRMAEEQYERRENEAETEKLLKLQAAMKNKPKMASTDGGSDEAWNWADWVIRVTHGLPMPVWWTNPQSGEEWSELLMPYWMAKKAEMKRKMEGAKEDGQKAVQSPKSNVQSPKRKSSAARNQAKSKRVRPRQTKSDEKSDLVKAGQTGSNQNKASSIQSGASRPIEENETNGPNGSGAVKPGQTDSEQAASGGTPGKQESPNLE